MIQFICAFLFFASVAVAKPNVESNLKLEDLEKLCQISVVSSVQIEQIKNIVFKVTSEMEAQKAVERIRPCRGMTESRIRITKTLAIQFADRNFVNPLKAITKDVLTEFATAPHENLTNYIEILDVCLWELARMRPLPFDFVTLGHLAIATRLMKLQTKDLPALWQEWFAEALSIFESGGKISNVYPLIKQALLVKKDPDYVIRIQDAHCNYLKAQGKFTECLKIFDDILQKSPPKDLIFRLQTIRISVLNDLGRSEEALALLEVQTKKKLGSKVWTDLLFGVLNSSLNRTTLARNYLISHVAAVKSINPDSFRNPLISYVGRAFELNVLQESNEISQAWNQGRVLIQQLNMMARGSSTIKFWIEQQMLVLAVLKNDKGGAKYFAKEARATLSHLPDLKYSLDIINALEAKSENRYKPEMLQNFRVRFGKNNPHFLRLEKVLNASL